MAEHLLIQLALLAVGLYLLWGGAELLVKYSVQVASSFGISPLIIGLTVVSIGTSLPELFVSTVAAIENEIGISIGNILGSNIANLGLILGLGALIYPLPVQKTWLRREVPFMILVTLVFVGCAITGFQIGWAEGVLLLLLFALFVSYILRYSLREMAEFEELQKAHSDAKSQSPRVVHWLLIAVGIAILVGGSKLTVFAAVRLAEKLDVNNTIIGLTLIALGTSLPELATTLVSAAKKEVDLAIGNIIGSNIFNLVLVGGITAFIRPVEVDHTMLFLEIPILVFITLIVWPIMRTDWRIIRGEGFSLLLVYILFITFSAGIL